MSIAQAERLKAELTDKYVVVYEGVPELRRFLGLTGTVKTVNMSCRALVQFDGPVDISWYDIDPAFLKVVAAPQPKKAEVKPEAKAEAAPVSAKPAVAKPDVAKPAVAKPAGKSPLDAIRAAGAPKPAAAAAVAAPAAGPKASPLDAIRKQMAAKGGAAPAAPAPVAEVAPTAVPAVVVAPSPVAPPTVPAAPIPSAAGRPKSTADIMAAIRKQGPGK